ncbi:hypothetical protein [Streptomyces sp. V2I9]|nr:hypothetical protein [Streptomyces sp. V2I9]MDQ0982949.1 hypothetical protein [Streptomyces sp. V2I9]
MSTSPTLTSRRHPDGGVGLAVTGEIDLSNSHLPAAALDEVSGPVRCGST